MIRERITRVNTRMTKTYASLRLTMLINLLFAIGIAVVLFLISNILLDTYVENVYLGEEKRNERIDALREDLETYVTDNELTCSDISKLSEWAKEHKYLYMLIYQGDSDKPLYETGQGGENASEIGENKENADDGTENSVDDSSDPAGVDKQEKSEKQLKVNLVNN